MEVLDRYDDGRPHHVRLAVKVLGRLDEEILEFRWGPDWLVWDAEQTKQQYAQHVEYTLHPDYVGNSTTVTIDINRQRTLAVLVSGGLDSAILLAEACRERAAVFPLYVRCGLRWEEAELDIASEPFR